MLHTRYSLIQLMGIDDEVLSAAGSMMRDKEGLLCHLFLGSLTD